MPIIAFCSGNDYPSYSLGISTLHCPSNSAYHHPAPPPEPTLTPTQIPIGLSYLPDELLLLILQFLNDDSICQLAMTCHSLNFIALPYFFTKNQISDPLSGQVVLGNYPRQTIPALCISFFLTSLTSLSWLFNPPAERLLKEVHGLHRLLARISDSNKGNNLLRVELNLRLVDAWIERLMNSGNAARIEVEEWKDAFSGLLDAVLALGCKDLTVVGGQMITRGLELSVVRSSSPLDEPTHPSRDGSVVEVVEMAEPTRGPLTVAFPMKLRLREKIPLAVKKTLSALKRRRLQSSFVLNRDQLVDEDPVGDHPRVLSYSSDSAIAERGQQLVDKDPVGDHLTVSSHSSDSAIARRGHTEVAVTVSLTTFNIIHSSMLLYYPFRYHWTLKTLNTSPLTTLSLESLNLSTADWSQLLPYLILPSLSKLSIANCRIIFADLTAFLTRHPSITTLDLNKSTPIPYAHNPPFPKDILPELTTLIAYPEYLIHLLRPPSDDHSVLPALTSITLPYPPSLYSSHQSDQSDLTFLDTALSSIAIRPLSHSEITLTLEFWSSARMLEWFTRHVLQGPKVSVLGSLHHIGSLRLLIMDVLFELNDATMEVLARWLGLFPRLQYVMLGESSYFINLKEGAAKTLVKPVGENCPRVEVMIGGEDLHVLAVT